MGWPVHPEIRIKDRKRSQNALAGECRMWKPSSGNESLLQRPCRGKLTVPAASVRRMLVFIGPGVLAIILNGNRELTRTSPTA